MIPPFKKLWPDLDASSLLGEFKAHHLYNELVTTPDGPMAEVGVFRGGTAQLIAGTFPERRLYLYDTFKGIVCSEAGIDFHKDGEFDQTSYEAVKVKVPKAIFCVGQFPSTFDPEAEKQYSFVHSDTDTYFGTCATLLAFGPRMMPGGVILFDDWRWPNCPGVTKALNEFKKANQMQIWREHGNQLALQF